MPELPEVETVAGQLAPLLAGRKIARLHILDPKLEPLETDMVCNRAVLGVERMGKLVALHLSGRRTGETELWLCFHLGMTGRLIWDSRRSAVSMQHLRARLDLDRGSLLFYDIRRFGRLRVFSARESALPRGCDPLSESFTPGGLERLLSGSRQMIKPWLLRQDRLAGLGNIYASEILFAAGIDCRRPAGSLKRKEIARLHESVRVVLGLAIENRGTTFSDYRDTGGRSGAFQSLLAVYGRAGEPCPRCGGTIQRIVQQQRSSFFCPRCQK